MKKRSFLRLIGLTLLNAASSFRALGVPRGTSMVNTSWYAKVTNEVIGPKAVILKGVDDLPTEPFTIKGVCYSPCPINGSNAYAPAIGDWYWDTFYDLDYKITGWDSLWKRDLPIIRNFANCIRVYSMLSRQLNADGTLPIAPVDPSGDWNLQIHLFTHQNFLDACWNDGNTPLFVLVGIPLPDTLFWKNKYESATPNEINYWQAVLFETVATLAAHPAVMGFTIQNELDGADMFNGGPLEAFWWMQVDKLSRLAKRAMGANKKLVGMAVHDAPTIPGNCESYMQQLVAIDFWGINSYRTEDMNAVLAGVNGMPGYKDLSGIAMKPVIITEWGMPATGHRNANDPSSIYADAQTISRAAAVVAKVATPVCAGKVPLCCGLYYFEYSDERWNQPGSPSINVWYGGTSAPGLPNLFWDQDGFGLYDASRGPGLNDDSPIWIQNGGNGAPALPIDVLSPRRALVDALVTAFRASNNLR